MIENFESITDELSSDELDILPIFKRAVSDYTEHDPIKSADLVNVINTMCLINGVKPRMSEVRLRKMTNYVRTNAIIPLIATSKGYFVSYDDAWVRSQIRSLRQRAHSIDVCADGLERFIYDPQRSLQEVRRENGSR